MKWLGQLTGKLHETIRVTFETYTLLSMTDTAKRKEKIYEWIMTFNREELDPLLLVLQQKQVTCKSW